MSASAWRRRARNIALAAALLGACGPPKNRTGDGEPIRTIREVSIDGNEELSDDAIEAGLATRERTGWIRWRYSELDPFDLDRDEERIVQYYRRRGFFRARVARIDVDEVGTWRADVTFVVDEGPSGTIRSIDLQGAPGRPGLTRADLLAATGLETGARFDYETFQDAKDDIQQRLVGAGYARAKVTGVAEVDQDSLEVAIALEVSPGPRNVFGATKIEGNELVPKSSIRARLAWNEGERFRPRKLAATRRQLLNLGRFSTVGIELEGPRERPEVDVAMTVKEAPRNELRLGGGAGIDDANYLIRGRAAYLRHGVLDPLTTLRIDLRPAYAIIRDSGGDREFVGEAETSLIREDLLYPLVRGVASIAYTRQTVEAYDSQGTRLALGISRGFLSQRLRIGLGWRYQLLAIDPDPLIDAATVTRLGASSPYSLGYFEQSIAYDARDNPLDARRGIYAEIRLEESGPFAASEFSYTRLTPEVRGYLPLGTERLIAASRVRVGNTLSGSLPITQRYYAGGASSQRGFPQRRLSPVVGDPADEAINIGGNSLIETNVEARVDVWQLAGYWLGFVLFLDGADVTESFDEIDAANLHWATGIGLRYNTIIGPVRFDLGYRLNRLQELRPGDRFAFHLSLGEAF